MVFPGGLSPLPADPSHRTSPHPPPPLSYPLIQLEARDADLAAERKALRPYSSAVPGRKY